MLLAAVCLGVKNFFFDYQAKIASEEIIQDLKEQINDSSGGTRNTSVYLPENLNKETNLLVDDQYYCGILEIPTIDIELPVSADYSYAQMSETLCRYTGNLADRNMIICGHNCKSFFGDLNEVNEGDDVVFVDCTGVSYTYVVTEIQIVGGYEVRKLVEGGTDWDLTVFTCTYGGSSRLVLRCKLKDQL